MTYPLFWPCSYCITTIIMIHACLDFNGIFLFLFIPCNVKTPSMKLCWFVCIF